MKSGKLLNLLEKNKKSKRISLYLESEIWDQIEPDSALKIFSLYIGNKVIWVIAFI